MKKKKKKNSKMSIAICDRFLIQK